jgi:hypothetical protein
MEADDNLPPAIGKMLERRAPLPSPGRSAQKAGTVPGGDRPLIPDPEGPGHTHLKP